MLLIITNESDVHPNPVIDKLTQAGCPFFRLNTDKLISDYDISCFISNDGFHFEIRYKRAPHTITDKQVTCVWERRPIEPLTTYDNIEDENVRRAILEEADGFVRYLRYSLTFYKNILWIGHPINERLASSKMLQKMVAKELGFKIPKTIFSNELTSINWFNGQEIAIKPISSFDMKMGDGSIVFYTQKTTPPNIIDLGDSGFRNNINFIEEYIEKQYELRVTVINGLFYTARIDSQKQKESQGAIDWRQGYDFAISFVPMETPIEIKQYCLDFLQYFNLNFGCFDFIKDLKGEYVFLECNTNGQWMWLEDIGLDISSALAKVFMEQIKSQNK